MPDLLSHPPNAGGPVLVERRPAPVEEDQLRRTPALERAALWWEALAARVEVAVHRRPFLGPAPIATVFIIGATVRAWRQPLWFDEILTEYIAGAPTLRRTWQLLASGAESSPPLFHWISRASAGALGWTHLGIRAPAMLGFLSFLIGAYLIVRRFVGPVYASIGALAAYATAAPSYAVQARPYGLLLGATTVAFLGWHVATRGDHRIRGLSLLGAGLVVACGVHYYAVLSLGALAVGEIVRTWRRHRIDGAVWLAMAIGTTPLWLSLPLIRANLGLRQGYFSPATWANFGRSSLELWLPASGALAALVVLATAAALAAVPRGQARPPRVAARPAAYEWAAWIALLLAPIEAFAAGRFVTHVYVARYAIIGVVGFSILLPLALQRLVGPRPGPAVAALAALTACSVVWWVVPSRMPDYAATLSPWLRRANPGHYPIVVADPLTYLPLAHDAPTDIAPDLVYVPDPDKALAYKGISTADRNLAALAGAAPLRFASLAELTRRTEPFLVLWEASNFTWIVAALHDAGVRLDYLGQGGRRILFVAHPTAPVRAPHAAQAAPPGR